MQTSIPPAEPSADADTASVHGTALYSAANYDPAQSLGRLLRKVVNSIGRDIDTRMADLDLTNKQWTPLIMLMRCRCHTAAELARELEVDTGAMTRMLDRLEGKGFIRREPSADDRRVVKLALTAEGEQVSQRVPEILSASFNRHLAGFTVDELAQLVSMLKRMLANGVGAEAACTPCAGPDARSACDRNDAGSNDPASAGSTHS